MAKVEKFILGTLDRDEVFVVTVMVEVKLALNKR